MAKAKSHKPIKGLLEHEKGYLLYYGFPVREMLAYPVTLAAKLVGLGRSTLYTEAKRGNLKISPSGLIAKTELERYAGFAMPA